MKAIIPVGAQGKTEKDRESGIITTRTLAARAGSDMLS